MAEEQDLDKLLRVIGDLQEEPGAVEVEEREIADQLGLDPVVVRNQLETLAQTGQIYVKHGLNNHVTTWLSPRGRAAAQGGHR